MADTSTKTIADLQKGDTCYMFGGFPRGATGGIEVEVTTAGRAYLHVRRAGASADTRAVKFCRQSGIEAADTNYKRLLVLDRDAYLARQKAIAAHAKLRRNIGAVLPDDVTLADIEAAAALLKIDLNEK
jgi:hypothetical protein